MLTKETQVEHLSSWLSRIMSVCVSEVMRSKITLGHFSVKLSMALFASFFCVSKSSQHALGGRACHLGPLSGFDSVLSSAGGWTCLHSVTPLNCILNVLKGNSCTFLLMFISPPFLQRPGFRHHKKGTATDYALI